MTFRVSGPAALLAAAWALAAFPAVAQKRGRIQKPVIGKVTIDQYRLPLLFTPQEGYFKSPGPVRIILEDAVTGQETVLIADDAEGRVNGDIVVHGAVKLTRQEGVLTGNGLTYNASDATGSVLRARVEMGSAVVQGARVELLPGQIVRATDASFTTCINARPDYHITAREITVDPKQRVRARNITFWLGRTRILSLPSFTRSFKHASGSPIPLPSYSKENFVQLRFRDDIISEPQTSFAYNISLSARRTPEGTVTYEHDIGRVSEDDAPPRTRLDTLGQPLRTALEVIPPPTLRSSDMGSETHRRTTVYALAAASTNVYNRKRNDLHVSRLPEIGIRLWNMTGRSLEEGDPGADPLRRFLYAGDWLINLEAGVGWFQERPTRTHSARASLQGTAASPLFPIAGGLHARYGFTGWSNLYEAGRAYTLLAPEFELDYLIGKGTLIGAAYRYQHAFGQTPFVFDRSDITHEARLRYGYLGGRWAWDFGLFFDIPRHRAYDLQASIRRRLDCLEVGIGYSARTQGINLILNLLPPARRSLPAAPAAR